MGKVIVLATPIFLAMMALEFLWARAKARKGLAANNYRLNDTLNSVSLGMMGKLGGILSKALTVGIYTVVFSKMAHQLDLTYRPALPILGAHRARGQARLV